MKILRTIGSLFVESGKKWAEDRASRLAAALAYYTLFSLAPLLIILADIGNWLLGKASAIEELPQYVESFVGPEAADWVLNILEGVETPNSLSFSSVIGFIVMLWAASNIFNHLKATLNIIWGVKAASGRTGIIATIRGRLLAFATVLLAGLMLVIFLLLNTVVAVVIPFIADLLPDILEIIPVWRTIQIVQFLVAFVVITILIAIFFKVLPDVEITWRDVYIGAALTSLLITIGTAVLSLYFSLGTVASLPGVAGSLLVMLLWVYYSAQIFLFGAEFTEIFATRHGSQIRPSNHAITFETIFNNNKKSETKNVGKYPEKVAPPARKKHIKPVGVKEPVIMERKQEGEHPE